MVARIKIGRSISRGVFYNENKVKEGVAELLTAVNYPRDAAKMSDFQRLHVLEKTATLRDTLKANSVHISLNFDPSEQLSNEQMTCIAKDYMERIGFAGQPYLVYRHYDAGHPHLHLVSTKVTLDGGVVDTNYIAKKKSEPARKALELEYNLVRAEDQKTQGYKLQSAYAQKVIYGKTESRKAIDNVLREVINAYKYTSLPELNAVLSQYNVIADPGAETSRTHRYNGLHYRILDNNGRPVGVPIKASSFTEKPTLAYLGQRFAAGETGRTPFKGRIKNAVDLYFLKGKNQSVSQLRQALLKDGISMTVQQNEQGILYGITYVDHKTKCVFNGSALGKQYSAKAIQERCGIVPFQPQAIIYKGQNTAIDQPIPNPAHSVAQQSSTPTDGILSELFQHEYGTDYLPYELRGRKKKKRKGQRK